MNQSTNDNLSLLDKERGEQLIFGVAGDVSARITAMAEALAPAINRAVLTCALIAQNFIMSCQDIIDSLPPEMVTELINCRRRTRMYYRRYARHGKKRG